MGSGGLQPCGVGGCALPQQHQFALIAAALDRLKQPVVPLDRMKPPHMQQKRLPIQRTRGLGGGADGGKVKRIGQGHGLGGLGATGGKKKEEENDTHARRLPQMR